MDLALRPAHYDDLEAVERTAWAMLVEGVAARKRPFHQVAVASVAADGAPTVRTVVLRGADEARRTLRFHTDARSRKFAELQREPRCSILAYDHDAKVQVRAEGLAKLHNRDERAAAHWDETRTMSRECYRQPSGPGERLADPAQAQSDGALSEAEGFTNFVAVELHVRALEWLYLAAAGHRRALITYEPSTARVWLAP